MERSEETLLLVMREETVCNNYFNILRTWHFKVYEFHKEKCKTSMRH